MSNAAGSIPEFDFDIYSPEFLANPFPYYEEMRKAGPVFRLPRYDVYGVSRYEDVQAVLRDYERFCSSGGASIRNYFKEKPWRTPSPILETDPPMHTRARAVLTRILSPAAIEKLKKDFQADATKLIDRLVASGRFDAVKDIGEVFPVKVFPEALGLPDADRSILLRYAQLVVAGFGPKNDFAARAEQGFDEVIKWVNRNIQRDALRPNSFGMQVYEAADAGQLTPEEAPLLVRSFLSAGLDTSIRGLSRVLLCLAENPEQWHLLSEKPSLGRAAFEEMLRYNSPAQNVWRTTTQSVEIKEKTIGKHEKVGVFLGAANRDPDRWEEPDKYMITRKSVGHVGLGFGIHACVGQAVARLEGEIILSTLASKVAVLEQDGPVVRRNEIGERGIESIPLRVKIKAEAA
jgi:cytochrome P450